MKHLIIFISIFTLSLPAYASGATPGYLQQGINLLVLLALLGFIAMKKLPTILKNRAQDIRHEIEKGQKELEAAQQRNEELQAELANLGERIEAITKQAEADSLAMETKMGKQIEDERKRIQESTRRSIEEELNRAKAELQRESVEISVELAAELLKEQINEDDHKRLAHTFVEAVAKEGTHG